MEGGRLEQKPALDWPRFGWGHGLRDRDHPFFPMSSRWMEPGFNDTMHGALSMVWGLITFVAVGLSAVAYRGWFRRYAIATDLVLVAFATASGIAIQGIEQNDTSWAGAFERVNAYALMGWYAMLAVAVMRRSLSPTGDRMMIDSSARTATRELASTA